MKTRSRTACSDCEHRREGILSRVEDDVLSRMERQRTVQVFRPGQELFCEGGPVLAVYCLLDGSVRITMAGDSGEELVLGFREPGYMLGLRGALAGEPHQATAVAVERSTTCTIPVAAFNDALDHSPAAVRAACASLARDVRTANQRVLEILSRRVLQRTAHLLLTLHQHACASQRPKTLRLRRSDLAHMIGTTPETLSRALHELEARKVVSLARTGITICDERRLRAVAQLLFEES